MSRPRAGIGMIYAYIKSWRDSMEHEAQEFVPRLRRMRPEDVQFVETGEFVFPIELEMDIKYGKRMD